MAFTFTINGHTYTSDPAVSVADGYRFNGYGYLKAIANLAADIVTVAAATLSYRDAAAGYAATALSAPGTSASSATSVVIPGAGAIPSNLSFTIETGKSLIAGMTLKAVATAAPDNYVIGDIQSYNSGTGALVLRAQFVSGAGTYAAWSLALSAVPLTPPSNSVVTKSAADTMYKAYLGQMVIATGTFTLGYDAAATLANGWYHYLVNEGTGTITLDPNAAETINGAATLAIPPGWKGLIFCDGAGLRAIAQERPAQYLHVRDEKSSGTHGGASVAADFTQTRTLNTVVTNNIVGAALASDQITLPAGTYDCRVRAPAYQAGANKAALYNVSDGAYQVIGANGAVAASTGVQVDATVTGRFTISAMKTFSIRHYTGGAVAVSGLGIANSTGQSEVYAEAQFWRIS